MFISRSPDASQSFMIDHREEALILALSIDRGLSAAWHFFPVLSSSLNLPAQPKNDQALFRELEAVSLTEGVVAALKDAFFSGALKPGSAIVERQIAQQMNVGTPVVREALISLKHEGFVRRVKNKGTFITAFDPDEVRQLYTLRVELETLALQWARPIVTKSDLDQLKNLVDRLVEAGQRENRREFLERDIEFHRRCWKLSGNPFLAETLERLMAPLFAFVVLASGRPMTAAMGREHYALVEALRSMEEPDFSALVRKTFTGFAFRWISSAMPKTEQ
jgi:DNA-binding GntR family transcriptional regulator